MITPLSGKQGLSGLSGFESKIAGFEIPAGKNSCPKVKTASPSVIQYLNNMLILQENQKASAWAEN
jgi:hypothetical protein